LDTRTGILGSIAGPCDFLPARPDCPTNFKKSATVQYTIDYSAIIKQNEIEDDTILSLAVMK
jgi:hypothetical protein